MFKEVKSTTGEKLVINSKHVVLVRPIHAQASALLMVDAGEVYVAESFEDVRDWLREWG